MKWQGPPRLCFSTRKDASMDYATCAALLSATHFATSLLPLTVRLIPVIAEVSRLVVRFRRAEPTPQACHQFEIQLQDRLRELGRLIVEWTRPPRDDAIDVARGLAVVTMIAANLSARTSWSRDPLWFRCLRLLRRAAIRLARRHDDREARRRTRHRGFRFFLDCAASCSWRPESWSTSPSKASDPSRAWTSSTSSASSLPLGFLACVSPTSVRWGLVVA